MNKRLYVVNGLITVRLVPELAIEVGLHESLILLQLDYLLATRGEQSLSDPTHRVWIRISTRDLQSKFFPFWSVATIDRTVADMIESKLLDTGNFNLTGGDTTRWLTYGERCETLDAVKLVEVDKASTVAPSVKTPKPASAPSAPPPPSIYAIATTIAQVCHIDMAMNKGRMLKEAKLLASKTPTQIVSLFGEKSPWYSTDFRGKQGSPPSPTQIRSEWDKMQDVLNKLSAQQRAIRAPDGGLNV